MTFTPKAKPMGDAPGLGRKPSLTDNLFTWTTNLRQFPIESLISIFGDRKLHFGTQKINTVEGLETALDGKQPVGNYILNVNGKTGSSITLDASNVGAEKVGTSASAISEHEQRFDHASFVLTNDFTSAVSNLQTQVESRQPLGNYISFINGREGENITLIPSDIGAEPAGSSANAVNFHEQRFNHLAFATNDSLNSAIAELNQLINTKQPMGEYILSVNGKTGGAISLSPPDIGAEPVGSSVAAVSDHEARFDHTKFAITTHLRATITCYY